MSKPKLDFDIDILRHSTAHVLAAALVELYGDVKFGVGPSVENGFYYDIELPDGQMLSSDDFSRIEKGMKQLVKRSLPFERSEINHNEAKALFAGQPYKLEIISELPADDIITSYSTGAFRDLCRGPHLDHTGQIKAFKLTKLAGAYWRGDSARPMLTRVYGTAFFSQAELDEYLHNLEEAEKRDHRKLGQQLGIYITDDLAGVGLPLYLPAGAKVIRTLQEWLRQDLEARDYQEVITPHIYDTEVWKMSGHYDFYHENMYFFNINEGVDKDGNEQHREYAVKPMNCPGHVLLYKSALRSYKELPLRYFEFGTVYRHEMSGVVHGLLRARGFTQDDAHIFCTKEQLLPEIESVLELVDHILGTFNFTYTAEISTRPEKSIGEDAKWEHAQAVLEQACNSHGLVYEINEGDGAFYGPKIDIKLTDAIGRVWQCSTIQIDFNFPERFALKYHTAENKDEEPWMIHRAIFGSLERFLGILLEHYSGALPAWLAPVQVAVVPISDKHLNYAEEVIISLKAAKLRTLLLDQNEPMRVKIAKAESQKVPYMLVLGDDEVASKQVSVRRHGSRDSEILSVEQLISEIAATN